MNRYIALVSISSDSSNIDCKGRIYRPYADGHSHILLVMAVITFK